MNAGHSKSLQIPLAFGDFQKNDFDSYLAGENKILADQLKKIALNEIKHCVYLWGIEGSGKSHLLQATCKLASEHDCHVAYIPLKLIDELSPEMLHDLGELDLVCIDDLDFLGGKPEWQQALVWLYNELRDRDHSLVMSACVSPPTISLEIEDLKSRLSWDQVYQLKLPGDDLKIEILKQKAMARSFELSDEVIEYIMRRVNRDLHSLMQVFDQIDHASLAAKRKITIPFIKEFLS